MPSAVGSPGCCFFVVRLCCTVAMVYSFLSFPECSSLSALTVLSDAGRAAARALSIAGLENGVL